MNLLWLALATTISSASTKTDGIELPLPLAIPRKQNFRCPELDLFAALEHKNISCIERAGQNMSPRERDKSGDTPLHRAIRLRFAPGIRLLVKIGADIYQRDFHGHTPRELAESLGYQRLANYFAELELESQRLVEAVENNDIVAASRSLTRGAPLGSRNVRLDSYLHLAAQSDLVQMIALLIHHGAHLEARNYLGETPLHAAALRGHKQAIAALLAAGANVNALDERRRTPLDFVDGEGDPELQTLLMQYKAQAGVSANVDFNLSGSDGSAQEVNGR